MIYHTLSALAWLAVLVLLAKAIRAADRAYLEHE